MSVQQKLIQELKAVGLAMAFFGCWIAMLVLIKQLVLAEYNITFHGFSVVLIGALILSKVVLILEHVPLGEWIDSRPAWVDVVLRTALYSLGVLIVLLLEKAFETRHEFGGFGAALSNIFQYADIYHVWVNTICLSGALLMYNILTLLRSHYGEGVILRLLSLPKPKG